MVANNPMTVEKMLDAIVKEITEDWDRDMVPFKYKHVAQRWNKVAARLGVDLRDLVKHEPRLFVKKTDNGGLLLFPMTFAESDDFVNVMKGLGIPLY